MKCATVCVTTNDSSSAIHGGHDQDIDITLCIDATNTLRASIGNLYTVELADVQVALTCGLTTIQGARCLVLCTRAASGLPSVFLLSPSQQAFVSAESVQLPASLVSCPQFHLKVSLLDDGVLVFSSPFAAAQHPLSGPCAYAARIVPTDAAATAWRTTSLPLVRNGADLRATSPSHAPYFAAAPNDPGPVPEVPPPIPVLLPLDCDVRALICVSARQAQVCVTVLSVFSASDSSAQDSEWLVLCPRVALPAAPRALAAASTPQLSHTSASAAGSASAGEAKSAPPPQPPHAICVGLASARAAVVAAASLHAQHELQLLQAGQQQQHGQEGQSQRRYLSSVDQWCLHASAGLILPLPLLHVVVGTAPVGSSCSSDLVADTGSGIGSGTITSALLPVIALRLPPVPAVLPAGASDAHGSAARMQSHAKMLRLLLEEALTQHMTADALATGAGVADGADKGAARLSLYGPGSYAAAIRLLPAPARASNDTPAADTSVKLEPSAASTVEPCMWPNFGRACGWEALIVTPPRAQTHTQMPTLSCRVLRCPPSRVPLTYSTSFPQQHPAPRAGAALAPVPVPVASAVAAPPRELPPLPASLGPGLVRVPVEVLFAHVSADC